jgi:hypothetical protein
VAKVRKFKTDIPGQGDPKPTSVPIENTVPDISGEAVESVAATAPVRIRSGRGNPRPRRYKQKTYSLLQEDIDLIERLVADIRQAGLYERGRSDIVRAGVKLLQGLSIEQQLKAVEAVESLKAK